MGQEKMLDKDDYIIYILCLAQIALIVLKLTERIDWNWVVVIIPMCLLVACLVSRFLDAIDEKRW